MSRHREKLHVAVAVAGLAGSATALNHQLKLYIFGEGGSFCSFNDYFSCDRAALSPFAQLLGSPQGLWGTCFFMMMILVEMILRGDARKIIRVASYAVGTLYCLRLFLLSVFVLNTVCLTCLFVHIATYTGLALAVWSEWEPSLLLRSVRAERARFASWITFGLVCLSPLYFFPKLQPSIYEGARAAHIARALRAAPPVNPQRISINASPHNARIGPENAPIQIVEFIDYTCPACDEFKRLLDVLNEQLPGQVSVLFKHFPLESECNDASFAKRQHPYACHMARLAQCAINLGGFPGFYHGVFDILNRRAPLDKELLPPGVSAAQLEVCAKSPEVAAQVLVDIKEGQRIGVVKTPFVVVNNVVLEEISAEAILKHRKL